MLIPDKTSIECVKGRDELHHQYLCALQYFNPRARRGRDTHGGIILGMYRDFNPRARMGRDLV